MIAKWPAFVLIAAVLLLAGMLFLWFGMTTKDADTAEKKVPTAKVNVAPIIDRKVQAQFEELVKQIVKDTSEDTSYVLSVDPTYNHPNYKKIIAMGQPCVPVAFAALRDNKPCALAVINGLLPELSKQIPISIAGHPGKCPEFWLAWWANYGSQLDWSASAKIVHPPIPSFVETIPWPEP